MILSRLLNLALLGLFPIAWQAPLARADVAWIFTTDEISIFSGILELYEQGDVFLSVVVALGAVVFPYAKTLALVYAQFSDTRAALRLTPLIEALGRLSMIDVFLVALYVIAYRGIGDIVIEWGLYFFTGLVLLSIFVGWDTRRRRFRTVSREWAAAAEAALARERAAMRRDRGDDGPRRSTEPGETG